jgi:hypothetical protein
VKWKAIGLGVAGAAVVAGVVLGVTHWTSSRNGESGPDIGHSVVGVINPPQRLTPSASAEPPKFTPIAPAAPPKFTPIAPAGPGPAADAPGDPSRGGTR